MKCLCGWDSEESGLNPINVHFNTTRSGAVVTLDAVAITKGHGEHAVVDTDADCALLACPKCGTVSLRSLLVRGPK